MAEALGFSNYATLASAWKKATFDKKDPAGRDIWVMHTHAHDMTEREITQTTITHLVRDFVV